MATVRKQCKKCGHKYWHDSASTRIYCFQCSPSRVTPYEPENAGNLSPARPGKMVGLTTEKLRNAGREGSPEADVALWLAENMDAGGHNGSQVAALAGKYMEAMKKAMAGAKESADPVDELRARREARVNGA